MNGNELMMEADKLLQKWDLYDAKDRKEIKKIFDGSNRYDMLLNIDVFQKQAVLYILGNCETSSQS